MCYEEREVMSTRRSEQKNPEPVADVFSTLFSGFFGYFDDFRFRLNTYTFSLHSIKKVFSKHNLL
jgi:hypothetical protein